VLASLAMAFRRSCGAALGRLRGRRSRSCSSLVEAIPEGFSVDEGRLADSDCKARRQEFASYRHKAIGQSVSASTSHLPPLPNLIPLPGCADPARKIAPLPEPQKCSLQPSPPRTPPRSAPRATAMPGLYSNHTVPKADHVMTAEHSGRASSPCTQALKDRCEGDRQGSQIQVTVVSAFTGEWLAKLALAKTAALASLKLQVEKVTGHSAFHMRFILDGCNSEEWCWKDFDSLETVLGDMDAVTIALVVTQLQQDHVAEFAALPFDACDRDYLPASGCVDDAIGGCGAPLCRFRCGSLQEVY